MEVLATSHVHSSWSYDGSWSLEALANAFGRRGSRVVMMTEHDKGFTQARLDEYRAACGQASSSSVYLLPGIEYSDPANRVHVLVWGAVPFLGEGLQTEEVLDAVAAHGGVAVLAHPDRKAVWECFRPEWADRLLGIERWNRKYDGWAPSERSADLLTRFSCVPFVGLDFHTQRQMFPLAMALEIGANIDEDAVVNCLKARRCAARAFGLALDDPLFQKRLPVLRLAEHGRRGLRSLKRYSTIRRSA
jgi:predicted metal-dependent phosphoesterase TrpH